MEEGGPREQEEAFDTLVSLDSHVRTMTGDQLCRLELCVCAWVMVRIVSTNYGQTELEVAVQAFCLEILWRGVLLGV